MNLMILGEQYLQHLAQSSPGQVKLGYNLLVTVQDFILDQVQREKGLAHFYSLPNLFPHMLNQCATLLWALVGSGGGGSIKYGAQPAT